MGSCLCAFPGSGRHTHTPHVHTYIKWAHDTAVPHRTHSTRRNTGHHVTLHRMAPSGLVTRSGNRVSGPDRWTTWFHAKENPTSQMSHATLCYQAARAAPTIGSASCEHVQPPPKKKSEDTTLPTQARNKELTLPGRKKEVSTQGEKRGSRTGLDSWLEHCVASTGMP